MNLARRILFVLTCSLIISGCNLVSIFPFNEAASVRVTNRDTCFVYEKMRDFDANKLTLAEKQNLKGTFVFDGTVLSSKTGQYQVQEITFRMDKFIFGHKKYNKKTITIFAPIRWKNWGFGFVPGHHYRVGALPLERSKTLMKIYNWSPFAYELGDSSETARICRPHNLSHD